MNQGEVGPDRESGRSGGPDHELGRRGMALHLYEVTLKCGDVFQERILSLAQQLVQLPYRAVEHGQHRTALGAGVC